MRTIIINNPGPQGAVGPQGTVGPSGSTQPFSNVSGSIWATTSSLQVTGSFIVSGSSTFTNIGPAVFSGSVNATSGVTMSSALVSGDVTVLGTASINVLQINTTINSTGSNTLGDSASDTQTLYGSVIIPTGSLTVSGSTQITGSLNVSGISYFTAYSTSVQRLQFNNGNAATNIGYIRGASDGIIRLNNAAEDNFTRLQFGGGTNLFPAIQRVSASLAIVDATGGTSGSLLIGTTSSAGYALDVSGSTRISGTGHVVNGSITFSSAFNINASGNASVGAFALHGGFGYATFSQTTLLLTGGTFTSTSGTQTGLSFTGGFTPTSGTATYSAYSILPTINQTGGANGITRGLYVNPTLTAAADFRAIETTSGSVIFNHGATPLMFISSSGNVGIGTNVPAYALDVRTTSGFIVSAFKSQFAATGYIGTDNSTIWIGRGTDGFNSAFVASSNLLIFRANNSQVGEFWSTGNLTIQTGGTYIDAGYKLDVKGSTRVQGAGTTSATTALRVENTNTSASLVVLDNGFVGINTGSAQYNLDVNGTARVSDSSLFQRTAVFQTSNYGISIQLNNQSGNAFSLGIISVGLGDTNFQTQGNYNGNNFRITAAGFAMGRGGLPTLEASALLNINSTTQGFLPPRMTNAQRVAISTPAVGLMVYCTDATEGLYIYKSTGWTFIV